jgi:hypothetical protein
MISKDTATRIAFAYREVETAEALLERISKALADRSQPDLRDAFGRQRGLQLGVPTSETGHTLFDVPWNLAKPIIEHHIATQKAIIATLTETALTEAKAHAEG